MKPHISASNLEKTLLDLCEDAWGLIANVGGGDWTQESTVWQKAAARWRDAYFELYRSKK